MKKLMLTALILMLALSLNAAAAGASSATKIGIVLMIENGAFLDMKDGIISGLADLGNVDGQNAVIDYQCAQGDAVTLATICQGMDDGSYDLVITVATPTTQNFVALESETPCVFCSVASPVAAGILSDMNAPDRNATGTSNAIPADAILSLGLSITPEVKTFGLLYCTNEVNAITAMENARAFLSANGYAYEEETITSSAEVQTAAKALIDKGIDAMFVANDATVQAAVSVLAELCTEEGIPTYCCSATTVQSGCLATLAMSDFAIGEATAQIAGQVLSGTKVSDIPAVVVPADIVSVNTDTLAALGLALPEEVLAMGEIQYISSAQ